MDSDSDIEIVPSQATKPPPPQGAKRTITTKRLVKDKLPSLSPLPLLTNLKRPAEKSIDSDLSSPADSDEDRERNVKRTHPSASTRPKVPLPVHSPLTSSPELPEPSHRSPSPLLPDPLRFSPIGSPHAVYRKETRTSGQTSPPPEKILHSKAVIELGSSPLSSIDTSSSLAEARMPIPKKSTNRQSSSPISGPSSKSTHKDRTSGPNPNRNLDQSNSARPSQELSTSPIPVRKKNPVIAQPIDPDSSGELSDLNSIFGAPKCSSQPQSRIQNDSQGAKSSTNDVSITQRTGARNLSPALARPLHPHRTSTVPRPVAEVEKILPRSRSAPQKSDELPSTVDKGKGKAKQTVDTLLSPVGAVNENLLSDLEDFDFTNNSNNPSAPDHLPSGLSSSHPSPPPDSAPVSKSTANRIEKQAQAAQARLLREAKKAAKEKEKLDNRLQREANKLTLNRKETVAEVRMYVSKSLKKSKLHPFVKACEVLEQRISSTEGCMMNPPGEIDDENSEPKGVVRWVRTATKEWDEERGIFIPLGVGQSKETSEPTILVVWTGKEVDEVIASGTDQLMKKAQAIKSHYPQDQLFIVISGLETILKAERRNEDAMITNEARERLAAQRNEPIPCPAKGKSKSGPALPRNSRDKILKELEIMKLVTKAFVIRVEDKNEFANWLWEMTMEIGVRPYKSRKQELKSALRLEVSGTKGTNYEDTYIKMLSSLTRVTENEAKGIVSKFPTLKSLYQSWERGIEKHGLVWAEDMLIGCSKSNSMTTVNSNRKIGKTTSKRIFEIMYKVKNGDACL